MALSRVQTLVTYSSSSGGHTYHFDVLVDAQGLVSVKNLTGPAGAPCMTGVPDIVLDDMQSAKDLVALLLSESEVVGGSLVFTGQAELSVPVVAGLLNNSDYRVLYTPPDAVRIATEDKTTTSFKAVVGVPYGSGVDPKTVGYSVLASTAATSTLGGTVTLVAADASQKDVSFSTALPTADYRVLLSPDGYYAARVINKTKLGFTIEIGIALVGAETVGVGYDVFV